MTGQVVKPMERCIFIALKQKRRVRFLLWKRWIRLKGQLKEQFEKSNELQKRIMNNLNDF